MAVPVNPFAQQEAKYDEDDSVPADAQFWKNHALDTKHIRVTLPEDGWEFADPDAYVGRDPEGRLYFDNFDAIPKDVQVACKIAREMGKNKDGQDVPHIYIKFYAVDEVDDQNVCAEFFAIDHPDVVNSLKMQGEVLHAQWSKAPLLSGTAYVNKARDATKVEVTLGTGNSWKAGFEVGMKGIEIKLQGNLRYKDDEKIKDGHCVRWDHDHLVFYEDNNSQIYTAYWMIASKPKIAGVVPESLKDIDQQFEGVTWVHPKLKAGTAPKK
jgi:hypothetical protein